MQQFRPIKARLTRAAIVLAVALLSQPVAALDLINIGTTPNDGTGDTLRQAFAKTNAVIGLLNDGGLDASGFGVTPPGAGAVTRTMAQRSADRATIADYLAGTPTAAFTAARTAAGTNGLVDVLEQYVPASSVGGADATWLLTGRGTKTPLDNLVGSVVRVGRRHNTCAYPAMAGGTTGGFFSNYDCSGAFSVVDRQDYGKTILTKPFIIDVGFFHSVDGDTVNHPETADANNNRAITNALRALIVGPPGAGGVLVKQYKDLVGLDAHAIGRIDAPLRGVSGFATGAIQYGRGVATNEAAAQNPSPADFGLPLNAWEQSGSMAALQAILRPHYADADATHLARGALVGNDQGWLATSGVEIYSASHGSIAGRDGAFSRVLDMGQAIAKDAAIRMPRNRGPGTAGTLIEYDSNDYTDYVRDANTYRWISDGQVSFSVAPGRLRLANSNAPANASTDCEAGTWAWDAGYTYVCVAANTWKRSALASWP